MNTKAHLSISDNNGLVGITVSGAAPYATYDLYYVPYLTYQRWQWRRVYTGIECDDAGAASLTIQQPDPGQGYFEILDAADKDGDGLTDGYEAWFNYNGKHTLVGFRDSDDDGMQDGWEVEYGLNPTSAAGNDGAAGNPDGDLYDNSTEFGYYAPSDGEFDPLRNYNTQPSRPVVYISDYTKAACDGPHYFTISRSGDTSADLWVYYAVGGTLSYDNGDYALNPPPSTEPGDPNYPDGWPRIYLAKIPAGYQDVTVTITPNGTPSGDVTVSITPYAVSPQPQQSDPNSWAYVVDWPSNRATIHIESCPLTGMLVVGNDGADGSIATYNFDTGALMKSPPPFPQGAYIGRGVAIRGNEIFYSEALPGGGIHVTSFATDGSVGNQDSRVIKSPTDAIIQDLAFHYDPNTAKNELYVLTGYPNQQPIVFEVDPDSPDGQVIVIGDSQGIPIQGPADDCDGFVVLSNGNFLINDYDGLDREAVPAYYREYYGYEATLPPNTQRGDLVEGGLTIDLSRFDLPGDTGVALANDGTLYFMTGIGGGQTVAHVKITANNPGGELLTSRYIGSTDIEDIKVVPKN